MKEGIQRELENLGKYGCYILCLLKAGKVPEYLILKYYESFLEDGYIKEDCTVLNPTAILKTLTGRKYRVNKTTVFDSKADIIVAYYYNSQTGLHHFVIIDADKKVIFDPYGNSRTVREGVVESYRLFFEER